MKENMKHRLLFKFLPLTLIGITSCALPPREAWRVIQREGLIPYIAVEIGKKPVPPYVVRVAHPARLQRFSSSSPRPSSPAVTGTPTLATVRPTLPTLASSQPARQYSPSVRYFDTSPVSATPTSRSLDQPVSLADTAPKTSQNSVKRSPPVVAKSTSSTQRQKISIPNPPPAQTAEVKEEMKKPASNTASAPTGSKPTPGVSSKPEAKESTAVASTPKPSTPSTPKVSPKPTESPTSAPPVAKADDNSVISTPYGTPVPGRPGLVSSPYAGQYQLVDVTGLAAGQEVKCPYSGKIFKVPAAQVQAINKVPSLASPPASTEKKP